MGPKTSSTLNTTTTSQRVFFFFSSRRRHTSLTCDWSSDVCSSDLLDEFAALGRLDFFEAALAYMAGYGLKAMLIAQSLNQVDKAYGQNNSILDNCHVRVSFATNDARTAKRLSDALGTATELRAMKNYAGHRLSPWLGHLMVSRTETSRPLLTPGEVMQLPPNDEIVMVSGLAPIRGTKARYYVDPQLRARILAPPKAPTTPAAHLPSDDWTRLDPVPAPTSPAPEAAPPPQADAPQATDDGDTNEATTETATDNANGGIRKDPALERHEDIAPLAKAPEGEFDFDAPHPDEDASQLRHAADRAMSGNARRTALDPDDGIEL